MISYWVLLFLLAAIACFPFWFSYYPPLPDYPDHLARAYILKNYTAVESFQNTFYIRTSPIPNLAVDLFLLAALVFVDIHLAGKFFLTLMVLLFFAGCHRLGVALNAGRPKWPALLCCSFVYNSMFLYGFVNYIIGLGLFLITLAAWLSASNRWTIGRVVIVSSLAVATYLAHLSGFAFFAISVVVITLWQTLHNRRPRRDMIYGVIPLLFPAAAFLVFMDHGGEIGAITWNDFYHKVVGSLTLVTSYNYLSDFALLTVLLGAITVVVLAPEAAVRVEWPVFVLGIAFGLLFLVSPNEFLSGSSVDNRFVPPSVILILLSFTFRDVTRVGRVALAVCIGAMFFRILLIGGYWKTAQPSIEASVKMFRSFPEGARVYPIVMHRGQRLAYGALCKVLHYGVITRRIIVPDMLAMSSQAALVYRAGRRDVFPGVDAIGAGDVKWKNVFSNYDYVWFCNATMDIKEYLMGHAQLLESSDVCGVFRVNQSLAVGKLQQDSDRSQPQIPQRISLP